MEAEDSKHVVAKNEKFFFHQSLRLETIFDDVIRQNRQFGKSKLLRSSLRNCTYNQPYPTKAKITSSNIGHIPVAGTYDCQSGNF